MTKDFVEQFYNKELYRSRNAQQKDKHLERIVLETADTILTTVGGDFHQSLQEKVTKNLESGKIRHIYY